MRPKWRSKRASLRMRGSNRLFEDISAMLTTLRRCQKPSSDLGCPTNGWIGRPSGKCRMRNKLWQVSCVEKTLLFGATTSQRTTPSRIAMKSKFLHLLAVALFASTGNYALATPINTNVTFPDRPTLCAGGDASVSAGPLDVGTNVITGSTYYSGATGSLTCLFDLTVGNPQVLGITGVRFNVTGVVGLFPDVYV